MVAKWDWEAHCGPRQIPGRTVIPRIPSLFVGLLPSDLSPPGMAEGMWIGKRSMIGPRCWQHSRSGTNSIKFWASKALTHHIHAARIAMVVSRGVGALGLALGSGDSVWAMSPEGGGILEAPTCTCNNKESVACKAAMILQIHN